MLTQVNKKCLVKEEKKVPTCCLGTKELEDWLVGFYGISTFVGYLMQIYFYTNNQFSYFKHFSLA